MTDLTELLRMPGWDKHHYESDDAVFRLTIKYLDDQRAEAAAEIERLQSLLNQARKAKP